MSRTTQTIVAIIAASGLMILVGLGFLLMEAVAR